MASATAATDKPADTAPIRASAPQASAAAIVVRVSVPRHRQELGVSLEAPPAASGGGPYAYPADGSLIRIGSSSARVSASPGAASTSESVATALGVSLFGGDVKAKAVRISAAAVAGPASAAADTAKASVSGATVLGVPVEIVGGLKLALEDWGSLEVLATGEQFGEERPRSAAASVIGLRLELKAEHSGYPAGTVVEVGVVDVSVRASGEDALGAVIPGLPDRRPGDGIRDVPRRAGSPAGEPGESIPGAPEELVRPAPDVVARLSSSGFVFPIFGPALFGDTFGAYRSDVEGNWHHGEDIVAALGSPLLAVADGTVFSVGWNDIGGWRLWLRDTEGNEFYYAHLSAYSPLAVEGTKVRAGDVLGFVGNTGDAEGGVTHLHFEIHPADLLSAGYDGVVAPYPFLAGWRRAEDVAFAEGRRYVSATPGVGLPTVGAYLLEIEDIARTSGLVPGALERALRQGVAKRPPG